MPWQTAPGVLIIVGAFTIAGTMIPIFHQVIKGKKRLIGRDDFDFLMEQRDDRIKNKGGALFFK